MEVGKIIKTCRTEKGLTQEELANILFVSRQLISKWENGKSYPDLNQLIQLSDYFDLSLDELMRGDQEMIKKKDTQVKTSEKGKKILIVLVIILLLISLYYGALTIKKNNLYKNVRKGDWEEEAGITYVKRTDDAQYNVFKIRGYNLFTIPKTLEVTATPINSVGERAITDMMMLYYNGDKDDFYVIWNNGDLAGQKLQMDSSFTYKKELQPLEEQNMSFEFEKIFERELDKQRPYLEPFLDDVEMAWQEVNQ